MSHNFTVFVIARIIGGVSKGNVSLSFAVISDITPPTKRTKAMVIDWHCIHVICMYQPCRSVACTQKLAVNDFYVKCIEDNNSELACLPVFARQRVMCNSFRPPTVCVMNDITDSWAVVTVLHR